MAKKKKQDERATALRKIRREKKRIRVAFSELRVLERRVLRLEKRYQ